MRLLRLPDLAAAIAHLERIWSTPEDVRSRPFSRNFPFDPIARTERYRLAWEKQLDELAWGRTWGLFDGKTIVGHLDLKGGNIESELHRATLGIAIESAHCDRGHGRRMMETAIAWARDHGIAWIDLGVFSTNTRAHALYRKLGFVEVGTTRDRFRVDGDPIDDIAMTLAL